MKKLIFILFFLIGIHICLFAQDKLNIDYLEIQKYVTGQRSDFDALMQRYEANDSLLTEEEYALVYFGYSFTSSYCGSYDDFDEMGVLIENQQLEKAYLLGKTYLKKNPVSMNMLSTMFILANKLNKDKAEIKGYVYKYSNLGDMILSTGNGKSEETAYKVICINDEYQILNVFLKIDNIRSQTLVNDCDLMEFDSSKLYEGTQIYFNISRSLDYLESIYK